MQRIYSTTFRIAKENSMYLIELILGWLIGKRNGGEYFIMEDER